VLNKEFDMKNQERKKTFVITGATSGIGLKIVEGLLEKNHRVIGIGRSPQSCSEQMERLKDLYPDQMVTYLLADLSLQPDIHAVGREISKVLDDWGVDGLDGLVNNAGTFTYWQKYTPEGFETQWAVNHLAPFLLTNLLLPHLEGSLDARVITISSGSHYGAKLDWEDIQGLGRYNPLKAYKNTKLANVIFTAELNRRLGPDSQIRGLAADPGLVNTGIGEKTDSRIAKQIWTRRRKKGIPAEKSAAGILQLLLDIELGSASNLYWKHGKVKRPNPFAFDKDHGWRLWEISAQMTGLS
jgi:NAD(P)-dependent dehydrogenase (short-subunit alcohol dehydrogenase family)